MSYLVFALGALLSLCGAFAISAGYGIIQVERGWAGVIAGATALSGGIVTIALGFILHSLSGLHALHKTGLTPMPGELGKDEASELRPESGLVFNPEASMVSEAGQPPAAMPPAASLRTWPQHPTRPNLSPARYLSKSRGIVSPAARGTRESDIALPKLPLTSRAAPRVSQAAMEPPSEPGVAIRDEAAAATSEDEAETRPASAPAGEVPAEPAWNADDEPGLFDDVKAKEPPIEAQLQDTHIGPGESQTESGPRVTGPAELASIDAIFSEDHPIEPDPELAARKEGAEPAPEAIEPASLVPAPPFVSEPLPAADPREPSPPAVPAAGEAGLAIIGRYESEGTSYVMYADGSIEARSERGIFRFQSMAELKAFMESQA